MAFTNRQQAAYYYDVEEHYTPSGLQSVQSMPQKPLQSRQKKRMTRGEGFFYIAVNVALVFGVLQCARTFIGDSFNIARLLQSQSSVQRFNHQTLAEQKQLKERIRNYSSPFGIEELARNYLGMVGENELPVRVQ
jgi:cell division protein FtsB